jgi:methionyl-tRNA synthetase
LTMVAPEKARSVYKPEDVVQRHNSELANVLGNFVHRIISFTRKFMGPALPDFPASKAGEIDKAFEAQLEAAHQKVTELMDGFNFRAALEALMEFARACTKYVDEKAPWTMRKTDLEGTALTLAEAIQAIHFLSIMLYPFMPQTADKMMAVLSQDPAQRKWENAVKKLPAGTVLQEPQILFAKIEADAP